MSSRIRPLDIDVEALPPHRPPPRPVPYRKIAIWAIVAICAILFILFLIFYGLVYSAGEAVRVSVSKFELNVTNTGDTNLYIAFTIGDADGLTFLNPSASFYYGKSLFGTAHLEKFSVSSPSKQISFFVAVDSRARLPPQHLRNFLKNLQNNRVELRIKSRSKLKLNGRVSPFTIHFGADCSVKILGPNHDMISGIGELAEKMVELKKNGVYPLVYLLVKLALILPVGTVTVERAFSAMKLLKSNLRNKMEDDWMNDCMVTYIEKEIFDTISNEAVIQQFQLMKNRRLSSKC